MFRPMVCKLISLHKYLDVSPTLVSKRYRHSSQYEFDPPSARDVSSACKSGGRLGGYYHGPSSESQSPPVSQDFLATSSSSADPAWLYL